MFVFGFLFLLQDKLSPAASRRVRAIFGVVTLTCLILSNLVFLCGSEPVWFYIKRIFFFGRCKKQQRQRKTRLTLLYSLKMFSNNHMVGEGLSGYNELASHPGVGRRQPRSFGFSLALETRLRGWYYLELFRSYEH